MQISHLSPAEENLCRGRGSTLPLPWIGQGWTRRAVNSTGVQIPGPVSFYSLRTEICGKETPKENVNKKDTRIVCQMDGTLHSGPGHALVSQIDMCPISKGPQHRWRVGAMRWKASLLYTREMNVRVYSEVSQEHQTFPLKNGGRQVRMRGVWAS